jgi:hypothetical protein
MSRAAVLLGVCVAGTLAAPAGGRADDLKPAAPPYAYFTGTASRGGGDGAFYGLAGSVLVCEQKSLRPVAWFGASKPTDGDSHYLYLLIFKTTADFDGRRAVSCSFRLASSSEEGQEGTIAADLAGKKVEVAYKFPTDPKTHAVRKPSLTVGGREVKEGDPHVFVVDFTGDKVTYTPVKVEFPKDVPDVSQEQKGEEWGTVVRRAVEQLKKDSPELKKLLEADR